MLGEWLLGADGEKPLYGGDVTTSGAMANNSGLPGNGDGESGIGRLLDAAAHIRSHRYAGERTGSSTIMVA